MREATVKRETNETQITLKLNLDGGETQIDTGIAFFDHMLAAFATHGNFGLTVQAKGDLEIDCHHTVEDIGIVLGQAFLNALGDRRGIARFGNFYVPMDEALCFCALDLSNRPYLVFDVNMPHELLGTYDSIMTREFMQAFCVNAGVTLHIRSLYGENPHHITEAAFKAVARALRAAVAVTGGGIPSSKGVL